MTLSTLKKLLLLFIAFLSLGTNATEAELIDENRKKNVLRNIGHEILTCIGDDTSRILPVAKQESKYILSFDTEFGFDPDDIVTITRKVIGESQVSRHYLVGVERCETKELVYSFEIRSPSNFPLIHCGGRIVPKDCYNIFFIFLDTPNLQKNMASNPPGNILQTASVIIALLSLIGVSMFVFRRINNQKHDPNLIHIGAFKFDKRNMTLTIDRYISELSNKEAELLSILYDHVNTPVKREVILQQVWENDSEYVGRTLDVFISKLRKKLEADTSVKIVNIRGVGYKLIVNPA